MARFKGRLPLQPFLLSCLPGQHLRGDWIGPPAPNSLTLQRLHTHNTAAAPKSRIVQGSLYPQTPPIPPRWPTPWQVMPLIALFMPLDGLASVMDGVLLGSQQASWMSRTMVVTCTVCALGLVATQVSPGAGWLAG